MWVEPGGISQAISQNQTALGVGILHLHGFAVEHAQDIPGLRGSPARHVFRGRQDTHDVDAQTQLRRSPDRAQHFGSARHIRLHLFHVFRRLQRNAAGIEGDRFPDQHHGPVFLPAPRILQNDEFRWLLASPCDAQHAAHSQFLLILAFQYRQCDAGVFGNVLRFLRHARGRHDVGRMVTQVTGERRGVGTGFSAADSRFHATHLIRTVRQQGHGPNVFRRFLILRPIVGEPVPSQDGSLHHRLGKIRRRSLDRVGCEHRRGKRFRPGLPNLFERRAHGLSNAVQSHVFLLPQPQQQNSLGRKDSPRMNQRRLLILA